MLAKRVIPCLDVIDGNVVKGKRFVDLAYAGDAVDLAKKYYDQNADELVFLDITASNEKRRTMIQVVEKVARQIFIPFTVGGGIKTPEDIESLLKAGADKISVNTAAIKNPRVITEAAGRFGSQCIVVAIDAKKINGKWEVFLNGGRQPTKLDAIKWAEKAEELGAGEILLTSIDQDGTKQGYDIELTRAVTESVNIPVIASGGAGTLESMAEVLDNGNADAVLASSIFHYGEYTVQEAKEFLAKKGITVRL